MGDHQPLAVAVGGGLSAALSHVFSYTVDVLKWRKQVGRSWLPLHEGFIHGLGANLVGWSLHGVVKFVGYNALKESLRDHALSHTIDPYFISAILAEAAATVVLAPFQVCEVKLVADPLFAPSLTSALLKIVRLQGVSGLFSGFWLLFARQMVMVVIKYNLFERIARKAFYMLDENYEKSREIAKPSKIAGVLLSSIITSALCAIASSSFDVLFSHTVLSSATPSVYHMGLQGLFAGSSERILSCTINNFLLWLFYDYFKSLL